MNKKKNICIFCGKELKENECNNAEPFITKNKKKSVCCNECNNKIVVPTRKRENQ